MQKMSRITGGGMLVLVLLALPPACKPKQEAEGPSPTARLTPEQLKQVELMEIADQQSPVDVTPEQLKRLKLMKFLGPKASLAIFPVRIWGKETDAESAGDLAGMINGAGLCRAEAAKQSPLIKASLADPNEMNKLLDMAREFREYAKKTPRTPTKFSTRTTSSPRSTGTGAWCILSSATGRGSG